MIKVILTCLIIITPLHAELKEFKIGTIQPLSGELSLWGQMAKKGIELALNEIKDSPDRKYKIKVIFEDMQNTDLRLAATAAQKLINIDKVHMLAPAFVEDTEVVWEIATKKGLITTAIRAGSDMGLLGPSVFDLSGSEKKLLSQTLKYASDKGFKKLGIISSQNSYSLKMAKAAKDIWKETTGGNVIIQEFPPSSASDFRSLLIKFKQAEIDALYMINMNQGTIAKQAKELNLETQLFGLFPDLDATIETAPNKAINGLIFSRFSDASSTFIKKFTDFHQEKPSDPAEYAYDFIMIINDIIHKYGTTSKDLKRGLLSVENYQGASGLITIDENGNRTSKDSSLFTYDKNKNIRKLN